MQGAGPSNEALINPHARYQRGTNLLKDSQRMVRSCVASGLTPNPSAGRLLPRPTSLRG